MSLSDLFFNTAQDETVMGRRRHGDDEGDPKSRLPSTKCALFKTPSQAEDMNAKADAYAAYEALELP